jgi:hypothetical protein
MSSVCHFGVDCLKSVSNRDVRGVAACHKPDTWTRLCHTERMAWSVCPAMQQQRTCCTDFYGQLLQSNSSILKAASVTSSCSPSATVHRPCPLREHQSQAGCPMASLGKLCHLEAPICLHAFSYPLPFTDISSLPQMGTTLSPVPGCPARADSSGSDSISLARHL